MSQTLILLGDINFKGMADTSRNFERIAPMLASADVVFANLECCFHRLSSDADERRGFYVEPAMARALKDAHLHAVGNANNVNIGRAAILETNATLDDLGIAHVGAGRDARSAQAPLVIERDGVRYGILQRTAVYWPDNHEAGHAAPGVAVIRGHTAYRPALQLQSARTRPGVPPEVITWADPESIALFRDDIAALRVQADVVIASLHWGFRREVLAYQREFAQAAIDAGADLVYGHGPHMILPIELYRGKPIFYGLGNFSFHMAHNVDLHHEWLGMVVEATITDKELVGWRIRFVERDEGNRTLIAKLDAHREEFERLCGYAAQMNASLTTSEDGLSCDLTLGPAKATV